MTTQTTDHFTYVTHARTETVHLAPFDPPFSEHTLCGFPVDPDTFIEGDETLSGFLATCGRCRSVIDPAKAVEAFLSGKGK